MKRKLLTVLLIAALAVTLAGCPATGEYTPVIPDEIVDGTPAVETGKPPADPADPGKLLAFAYGYGSYHGGHYEFNITRLEDEFGNTHIYFRAEGFNGVDLYAVGEIDQSVLDELAGIIERHDIFAWNGFRESDDDVLDGYGFSLHADYENGALAASGYMKEPPGYEDGHRALSEYLETLVYGMGAPVLESADGLYSMWMHFDEGFSIQAYNRRDGQSGMVSYVHGDFRENYTEEEVGAEEFEAYIAYIADLYTRFKDDPQNLGDAPGGYLHLSSVDYEVDYSATIDKTRYPDEYADYLERSLAIVGKTPGFLQSEEYETETYKSSFIYPEFYFYDKDGLGAVVVDLPGQTVTVNGEAYTVGRDTMTDLYSKMSNSTYQDFPFIDMGDDEIQGGYLEDGQTAQGVFDGLIADGYIWIIGRNHKRDAFYLYGGKDGYPDGWEAAVSLVEDVLANAEKTGG